jgi:chromosome segregation ATPase
VSAQAADKKGKIQCWTNDEGIMECGNVIPPQYSQQGFKVYNEQGQAIKEVERAPTPEEIAAMKKKEDDELLRKEQEKKDQALLALFSTEKDIELSRTALLNQIDGQMNGIETILEGLKGNLVDLKESYQRSKENSAVTETQLQAIERNVESVSKRIRDTEDSLRKKVEERERINVEYDTYLARYQDIMTRRSQAKQGATGKKTTEVKQTEENQ